jgi:hypothetical protein
VQLRAGSSLIDLVPVSGPLGKGGGAAPGTRRTAHLDHFCVRVEPFDEMAIPTAPAAHGIERRARDAETARKARVRRFTFATPKEPFVELKGPASH